MCSALLLCSVPCSALADTRSRATPAEWATPSEITQSNDIILASVNGNDAPIYADIHDDATGAYIGNQKGTYNRTAGGHYVYRWPTLPEGQHYANVYLVITGGDLPKPGTYGCSFSMFQENLTIGPSVYGYVTLRSWADNVDQSLNSVKADLVSANGGWTGQATVTLGYSNSSVTCQLQWPEQPRDLEVGIPSTPVKFSFKLTENVPEVSAPDVDAGVTGEDAIIDINQGISNSVSEVSDQISELIQTIINQLDALWNQFSGVFTNMFTAWNTHVQTITNAIQNQGTTVSDGLSDVVNQVGQSSDEIIDHADQNTEDLKQNEDKNTNIITEALSALGNFIIEGLKSLFIPSDDFFQNWYTDLYDFFNDRLGLFMLPIDIVIQLINVYINTDSSFAGIPFPEFKWIDGTVIIPAQTVNFTFLETDWGQDIQQKIYFVTDIFMIFSLLVLLKKKLDEVFVQ